MALFSRSGSRAPNVPTQDREKATSKATFASRAFKEQERVTGRDKFEGTPLTGANEFDELPVEYLKTTKTGTYLIPPGAGETGFAGEGMFA